jgi:hypothetical protein
VFWWISLLFLHRNSRQRLRPAIRTCTFFHNVEVIMKSMIGFVCVLGVCLMALASSARATVRMNEAYDPIESSTQPFTHCAISFQPHPGTNSKVLIMTYQNTPTYVCPFRGTKVALQCQDYFCHSGGDTAWTTDYVAVYSNADSLKLLVRQNRCRSRCQPFGRIRYLPLPPENANYQMR